MLEPIVLDSRSVREVVTRLGLRPSPSMQPYLAGVIRHLELSTDHFLGQHWARGEPNPCGLARPAEALLVMLPAGAPKTKAHQLYRALLESGVPECCAACGLGPEWQGKPLRLQHETRMRV